MVLVGIQMVRLLTLMTVSLNKLRSASMYLSFGNSLLLRRDCQILKESLVYRLNLPSYALR